MVSVTYPILSLRFASNRLWDVGQAGCVAQMELPANAEGTPHAVFDSTGLVFAVTAAMAAGEGNVRIKIILLSLSESNNEVLCDSLVLCSLTTTTLYSIFICTTPGITLVGLSRKCGCHQKICYRRYRLNESTFHQDPYRGTLYGLIPVVIEC